VHLHDVDGDGWPDVIAGGWDEDGIYWYRNPGQGAADRGKPWEMLEPSVLGVEGGGHGFAFGDVNGDGREDVLTEIGWYERPPGDPFVAPWKLHPETARAHEGGDPRGPARASPSGDSPVSSTSIAMADGTSWRRASSGCGCSSTGANKTPARSGAGWPERAGGRHGDRPDP